LLVPFRIMFLKGVGWRGWWGTAGGGLKNSRLHRQGNGGVNMQVYIVYRAEYRTNKTVRIGKVVDHRRAERNNNAADMLRMAQKLYATSSIDSRIFIIRESSRLRLLFEDPMASSTTAGGGSRR